MTTPAEYRELALECMRAAESTDSAMMRLTMVGLARVWMGVAAALDQSLMRDDDDARKPSVRPYG